MSKFYISPDDFAKTLAPGLNHIAKSKVEQAVIDACIPYIKKAIEDVIKVQKINVDHDPVTDKVRFFVELDYSDWRNTP